MILFLNGDPLHTTVRCTVEHLHGVIYYSRIPKEQWTAEKA
jgi:hypothetical protein